MSPCNRLSLGRRPVARRIAGYNPPVSTMPIWAHFALPIMSAIYVVWFLYKWITNPIARQSAGLVDEYEEAANVAGFLLLVAIALAWTVRILYR